MSGRRIDDSSMAEVRLHKQPIDEVTAADSMVALLSKVNTKAFPAKERLAIIRLQSSALALRLNWLSDLCRTLADPNVKFRGDHELKNGGGASPTSPAQPEDGAGKWLRWARASYVAVKSGLRSS